MKNVLRLQDIINLEYFFHRDKDKAPAELHKRDREICLTLQTGTDSNNQFSAREKLHGWLKFMLGREFPRSSERSPGEIFTDSLRIISSVAIVKGLILGIVAGLAFFSYTGKTPVNVFQFLLLFIVTQLFFIFLLLISSIIRSFLPKLQLPGFYTLLFEKSVKGFIGWLRKGWLSGLDAGKRNSILHTFAIIRVQSSVYGKLFYWPIFSIIQAFGLSFNIALLSVTLLKIATSDLAFGWQSTIQLGDIAVFKMTQLLALPWSWLLGSHGYPTLTAIAGSRIILKDGVAGLATTDLTSWWPFLVLCLLFYGVTIRTLLLTIGLWQQRRTKKQLEMNTPQCNALLRRMNTPLVSTQAPQETPREKTSTVPEHPTPPPPEDNTPEEKTALTMSGQIVLIGIDLYEQLPAEGSEEIIRSQLQPEGLNPLVILPFQTSYEEDQQLLSRFASEWPDAEGILIILEGWMVPLADFLSYLGEIRTHIGGNKIISIGLVGRADSSIFTPVSKKDFAIWRDKVEALADPYIQLFPFSGLEEAV